MLLAAIALIAGCEYLNFDTSQPSPKTEPSAAAPVPIAPPPKAVAQSIELALTPPAKVSNCLVSLTAAVGSVPAILKIASYADPKSQSFPSIYIQAPVTAGKLSELIGQPISAKLFVALAPNGPVWESPDGEPAQITFSAVDEKRAVGTINAAVVNHGSGEKLTTTGRFDGTVK